MRDAAGLGAYSFGGRSSVSLRFQCVDRRTGLAARGMGEPAVECADDGRLHGGGGEGGVRSRCVSVTGAGGSAGRGG